MPLPLFLLTKLRAFESVARHGSFKRAAEELHVTQSALSHHVRHLETELGMPLVLRSHRRIELTAEGRQLCADCAQGFQGLEAAIDRLRRAARPDTLTLSVAPYFSARWLTPRLGRLWARHPRLHLQLHHAYQPADFLRDPVDAGIGWGDGRWPGVEARLVVPGTLTPVCSPACLATLPRKPRPRDLRGRRLFHEFDAAHWSAWFATAGVDTGVDAGPLDITRIDDSHALRRTALDGHGFALFFTALVREDLDAGLLVAPFAHTVDPGSAYYLVRPADRAPSAALQSFTQWLMDEVASAPFA